MVINLEYSDHRTYENILVSGVEYDFSSNHHSRIPRKLYADWVRLITKLAKAVDPAFEVPPLPEPLFFTTESIPSDGPYSSSPNYYMLDYVHLELEAENGCGLKINYELGRMGGGEPVCIETFGFSYGISSCIHKDSISPRANIYMYHTAEQTAEILEIIRSHPKSFYAKFRKWKTDEGTLLFEGVLTKIPFIYGDIGLEGGERFVDSAQYVETTMSGEIVKRYSLPQSYAFDDEMSVSNIHRVVGDSFYEFYYRQYRSDIKIEETQIFSGLKEYYGALSFNPEKLFV